MANSEDMHPHVARGADCCGLMEGQWCALRYFGPPLITTYAYDSDVMSGLFGTNVTLTFGLDSCLIHATDDQRCPVHVRLELTPCLILCTDKLGPEPMWRDDGRQRCALRKIPAPLTILRVERNIPGVTLGCVARDSCRCSVERSI